MKIITGYRGEPHITSQQDRNTNIAIFGGGAKILKGVDSEMAATVVSANEVQIADGMLVAEGCTACIDRGTSDSLTIENGAQGMQRIDLIVAQYTRNAKTAVEDMQLAVIKGTPSANDPATPAHTTGLIADGDSPVDFPIYAVHLNGISITNVERLVDIESVPNIETRLTAEINSLKTRMTTAEGKLPTMRFDEVTWTSIGIGANLVYTSTRDVHIDGYKPIGIRGYSINNNATNGKNAGWCILQNPKLTTMEVGGNTVDALRYTIWNQHQSQQAVVQITFEIAYISENIF